MGSFKFDWLSMRKKWVSLEENLSRNRLKKAPTIKQKEQETQTESKHPSDAMNWAWIYGKCWRIFTSNNAKKIISNFIETSKAEDSDRDDEVTSI